MAGQGESDFRGDEEEYKHDATRLKMGPGVVHEVNARSSSHFDTASTNMHRANATEVKPSWGRKGSFNTSSKCAARSTNKRVVVPCGSRAPSRQHMTTKGMLAVNKINKTRIMNKAWSPMSANTKKYTKNAHTTLNYDFGP